MSVNDDRPLMLAPAADPAPLGLGAFALTTFLLSAANAKWMNSATGDAWLGFAFAYGGLGQFAAAMWEFRNRNVFGATAFGTYGGFWIGLGLWALLVAPAPAAPAGTPPAVAAAAAAAHGAAAGKDLGWILLAFAIFNTYMLAWSTQVNLAVFGVFLTLEATEIILFIGFFQGASGANTVKIGGYVGILTALVAWYTSAAGVIAGMRGKPLLPVGKPFGARAA
ncbi:MAG TPA: acetate uptake transporter [Streptosporangiaceae bacterium]